jgi:hypothetical protein
MIAYLLRIVQGFLRNQAEETEKTLQPHNNPRSTEAQEAAERRIKPFAPKRPHDQKKTVTQVYNEAVRLRNKRIEWERKCNTEKTRETVGYAAHRRVTEGEKRKEDENHIVPVVSDFKEMGR